MRCGCSLEGLGAAGMGWVIPAQPGRGAMRKTLRGSGPCWGWNLCSCRTSSALGTALVCSSAGLSHTSHPGKIAPLLFIPLREVQASSLLSPVRSLLSSFPAKSTAGPCVLGVPLTLDMSPLPCAVTTCIPSCFGKILHKCSCPSGCYSSSSSSLIQSHSPFYSLKKELSRSKNLGGGGEDLEKKKKGKSLQLRNSS